MEAERRQVSYRLSRHYRERITDVIEDNSVPDIRSMSALMEDALWLWFHEYDLIRSKNDGARTGVGVRPGTGESAERIAVGQAS
jgi:hypothetical protein